MWLCREVDKKKFCSRLKKGWIVLHGFNVPFQLRCGILQENLIAAEKIKYLKWNISNEIKKKFTHVRHDVL